MDEGFPDTAGVAAKSPGAEMDPVPEEEGGVLEDVKGGSPEDDVWVIPLVNYVLES